MRPRAPSALLPAHPPRIRFHPGWWYRPGRLLVASRPRWRPCPDPRRVRPCAPGASVRLSSSRSAHLHPPDSSTLCSRSASCASDPTALGPPESASRSQTPWPIPARTLHTSRRCRGARSTASLRWPPRSSRRCPSAAPSAGRVLPAARAPTRTPHDAYRCRSSAASAISSSGPGFARPVQSAENAAAPANPQSAKRSHARFRSPRSTPPAALESKPQAAAMAALVAHDRSAHIILPQTRRTRHPPVTRSTAYRKDVPAPPLTPCARSRCLLASLHHSACSSPCAHFTNYPCGSHHLFFHVPRLAPQAANLAGNTVPSAGRGIQETVRQPESANHFVVLGGGNRKALSQALGAKGHSGGPNSAQRSMLLTAVRSRRGPILIPPTVTLNLDKEVVW